MNTLIIGGGAAGAAAAIAAAERGDHVTLWERNRKPLKKLGVTGNGRGNLLNAGTPVYYENERFAREVLRAMPYGSLTAFLERCGITLCMEGEGRVYPAALLACVAVEALRARMERLGVEIRVGARATAIVPAPGGGFAVRGVQSVYEDDRAKPNGKEKKGALLAEHALEATAARVIVAAGGAAAPAHGTDGSAYALLTALGHRLSPPRPALCPLRTEERFIAGLSGQRARARLSLQSAAGKVLHESQGEALFAQDGVSGIAAMQLARFWQEGCVLRMDLREALLGDPQGDALAWLERRAAIWADAAPSFGELLIGAATPELACAILRAAGVGARAKAVDGAELEKVAETIRAFSLRVIGTRGFEAAQVTAGGIMAEDFDPATMESKLVRGLYAAGELLDVDGDCGGYNLMFAFASGLLAGLAR
ncbi:MAG: aminoacetone oxidase family FAD-binding enzyme [Clostridia bacterium]